MQIIIQAITDPENVDRFTLRLIDRKIYDLDYKGSFHNDLDYQYKVIKNFYEERLGYNGAVL